MYVYRVFHRRLLSAYYYNKLVISWPTINFRFCLVNHLVHQPFVDVSHRRCWSSLSEFGISSPSPPACLLCTAQIVMLIEPDVMLAVILSVWICVVLSHYLTSCAQRGSKINWYSYDFLILIIVPIIRLSTLRTQQRPMLDGLTAKRVDV